MTLQTKRSPAGIDTASRPLCLHVYRTNSIWGDDKIVREDDKRTLRYYLKGIRLAAHWELTLCVGGPNGAVVCHVKSSYLGPPLAETAPGPISIDVDVGSERRTVEVRRGSKRSDGIYLFRGLDDREYRWRSISRLWRNQMECMNSQGQVVATYRITSLAITKDGELCIHQTAQSMTDLLVATCLAIRTPDY